MYFLPPPNTTSCLAAIIVESRRLIAASVVQRAATQLAILQAYATIRMCHKTLERFQRDYERPVTTSIATLLLSFPENETWISSARVPCCRLLNDLLDAGTSLVEEQLFEIGEPDRIWWVVRLTQRGMAERRACEAEAGEPVRWR